MTAIPKKSYMMKKLLSLKSKRNQITSSDMQKHSICLNENGPLMGPTKALTVDKYEMCCSLVYQFNSVFTKTHHEDNVTSPYSFFPMWVLC